MILGPDDPRAITGKARKDAEAYTERFNREVLGLKPLTAKQKADKAKLLDDILGAIGWEDPDFRPSPADPSETPGLFGDPSS